jgi:membrane associated rhomboid family serine protease
MNSGSKINIRLLLPTAFVLLMWLIKLAETIFHFNLIKLGIFPRQFWGLPGILFTPLIHAGFSHLISNSLPLIFLATGIIYYYKTSGIKIILLIYFLTGILIWLFARPAYHIGASGLIYGFAAFLFFGGIIRRDAGSIALSLIVTFLYGGMIWGVLPLDEHVSWEAHLFGGIVGIILSFVYKNNDRIKKYDWEDEPEEEQNEKPEISYKKGYPFD